MLGTDSFILARVANGGVVGRGPDELSRVSAMFRPVVERLLAVSPEGRQRVWDDFLAGRLRPSPIIEAVHELEPPTAASSLEWAVPDPPQPTPNHHGENAAEPERRVRLTCAVNLAPREVEWLWAGRVPLGMITMFAGDPKLGKSYVTLAMVRADIFGGAGGAGNYFSVGAQSGSASPVTLTLNGPQSYFDMWWSAADINNTLQFYSGSTLLATYATASVFTGIPGAYFGNPNNGGDSGEPFAYLNFNGSLETTFTSVVFSNSGSTGTGFESDNWSVHAVPEPSSLVLCGTSAAIVGLGLWRRRLKVQNAPTIAG
jgi:hypothetical protein